MTKTAVDNAVSLFSKTQTQSMSLNRIISERDAVKTNDDLGVHISITDNGTTINVLLGDQQFSIPRVRPELQIDDEEEAVGE